MSRIPPLVRGRRYYVEYRIPGVHRVKRSMVAVFLGVVSDKSLIFSGQPAFGTTELEESWCLLARGVDSATKPFVDRKTP